MFTSIIDTISPEVVEECNSPGKKNQKTQMLLEAFGISQHTMQIKFGVTQKNITILLAYLVQKMCSNT